MPQYVRHTALIQAASVIEKGLSTEAAQHWDFTEYVDGPEEFKSASDKYRLLQLWSTRLVFEGKGLQGDADRLFASVRHVQAAAWSRNADLQNFLIAALDLAQSADVFRQEVAECRSQLVALSLSQKDSLLSSLSDVADCLDDRIGWTINTVNRKLYEASTARLTYANVGLSGTAILITLASLILGK